MYLKEISVKGFKSFPDRTRLEFAPGVSGQCLVLDGLTTHLAQPAGPTQVPTNEFTIAAWMALGSYPLNWSPVVDALDPARGGFYFGVDAHGRLGLNILSLIHI